MFTDVFLVFFVQKSSGRFWPRLCSSRSNGHYKSRHRKALFRIFSHIPFMFYLFCFFYFSFFFFFMFFFISFLPFTCFGFGLFPKLFTWRSMIFFLFGGFWWSAYLTLLGRSKAAVKRVLLKIFLLWFFFCWMDLWLLACVGIYDDWLIYDFWPWIETMKNYFT